MKHKRVLRVIGAMLAPLVLGLFIGANLQSEDSSVVIESNLNPRFNRGKVENGSAYDVAVLTMQGAKAITVPKGVVLERITEEGIAKIYMGKTLRFRGHPPQPMSIRFARYNMGCAFRPDGQSILLGTFGEWRSDEGGASISVLLHVSEGIAVCYSDDLSGSTSLAQEIADTWLSRPETLAGLYWYGPASPAVGWKELRATPDPTRAAERVIHRR